MCMIRVWRTGAGQVGNSMMPVREGFSKQDRRSEKDGIESVWDWSCTKKLALSFASDNARRAHRLRARRTARVFGHVCSSDHANTIVMQPQGRTKAKAGKWRRGDCRCMFMVAVFRDRSGHAAWLGLPYSPGSCFGPALVRLCRRDGQST